MSTQHTPGPWELIETQHEKIMSSWHIKVGDHNIPVHPYKRIWSEDRTQSALVTDYQHMANARLIASAPELLEACQTFAEWLRREEDGFDHKTHNRETPEGEAAWREWFYGNIALCGLAQDQARAAIAKANGEAI